LFNLRNNFKKSEENYTGTNQYDKMLSAIDPWLGKIFQCINLKNTICVITSDHGSTFADFTNEMFNFHLENDRLREFEPGFSFNVAHKITTKFPKKLTPLRKKLASIYTKHRNDKVKKKLEPRLDLVENIDLSTYQKRLLKKSILYPCDCFDENFRPALIFLGPDIPSGKIISEQSSSIDLFPTILDLIKIPTKINHRGKSLVHLLTNTKTEPRVLMIDSASSESEAQYSNTIGLRTKQYKYFRDRFSEGKNVHLYDLVSDPLEEHNIYQKNLHIIAQMESELKKIHNNKDFSFKKTQNLSDVEIQNAKKLLKGLGYV
jgi:arylsulfatase A-like enzyme